MKSFLNRKWICEKEDDDDGGGNKTLFRRSFFHRSSNTKVWISFSFDKAKQKCTGYDVYSDFFWTDDAPSNFKDACTPFLCVTDPQDYEKLLIDLEDVFENGGDGSSSESSDDEEDEEIFLEDDDEDSMDIDYMLSQNRDCTSSNMAEKWIRELQKNWDEAPLFDMDMSTNTKDRIVALRFGPTVLEHVKHRHIFNLSKDNVVSSLGRGGATTTRNAVHLYFDYCGNIERIRWTLWDANNNNNNFSVLSRVERAEKEVKLWNTVLHSVKESLSSRGFTLFDKSDTINFVRAVVHGLNTSMDYCIICSGKLDDLYAKVSKPSNFKDNDHACDESDTPVLASRPHFTCCETETCRLSAEESVMPFVLYSVALYDPFYFYYHLSCLVAASKNAKRLEPYPAFLLKKREIRGRGGEIGDIRCSVDEENKEDCKLIAKTLDRTLFQTIKDDASSNIFDGDALEHKLIANLMHLNAVCENMEIDSKCSPEDAILGLRLAQFAVVTMDDLLIRERLANNNNNNNKNFNFIIARKREKMICIDQLPADHGGVIPDSSKSSSEQEKEKENRKRGVASMYHGTNACNMFSILRLGLRNFSQTKFMSCGAAYGNGIYLGRVSSTSRGYANAHYEGNNAVFPSIPCLFGLDAVVKGDEWKNGFSGHCGIAVVTDDKRVALTRINSGSHRYGDGNGDKDMTRGDREFILLHQRRFHADPNDHFGLVTLGEKRGREMSRWIQKGSVEAVAKNEALRKRFKWDSGMGGSVKVLFKAIQELGRSCPDDITVCTPDEDFLHHWVIRISGDAIPPDDTQLGREMRARLSNSEAEGGDDLCLVFEILFSSEFPTEPPFTRVVYPRFEQRTGHVMMNGHICSSILTKGSWSPAFSMENVIVSLISTLVEGDGKLAHNAKSCYTSLMDAVHDKDRMLVDHNWK